MVNDRGVRVYAFAHTEQIEATGSATLGHMQYCSFDTLLMIGSAEIM